MFFPSLNGIFFVDTTSFEDLVPKEINCFFVARSIWKDLLSPLCTRCCSDCPADFIGLGRDSHRLHGYPHSLSRS